MLETDVWGIENICRFEIIKILLAMLFAPRLVMGAGLLRACDGARVRRLEARLLLPDASLLHERGGTEPGESFSISTCAQPCVLPREEFAEHLGFYHRQKRDHKTAPAFFVL